MPTLPSAYTALRLVPISCAASKPLVARGEDDAKGLENYLTFLTMRYLWILCYCGHETELPGGDRPAVTREKLLPRCRCRACGRLGAKDMRLFWKV